MKFALITSNSIHHKYLTSKLYAHFHNNFSAVVIQKNQKSEANLKKIYYFAAFLHWSYNIFFKLYRITYFRFNPFLKLEIPTLHTEDVNSKAVIDFLKDNSIDYIIVYGGKIIKSQIISIWNHKIINLHNGYSPQYRGSNTLFWPILENSQYVGITIHYLTKDLDCGQLIMRELIKSEKFLFPETLQAYSFYRTTVLVEIIINMLVSGVKLPVIDSKINKKIYYSHKFTKNIRMKLRKKIFLNFFLEFK